MNIKSNIKKILKSEEQYINDILIPIEKPKTLAELDSLLKNEIGLAALEKPERSEIKDMYYSKILKCLSKHNIFLHRLNIYKNEVVGKHIRGIPVIISVSFQNKIVNNKNNRNFWSWEIEKIRISIELSGDTYLSVTEGTLDNNMFIFNKSKKDYDKHIMYGEDVGLISYDNDKIDSIENFRPFNIADFYFNNN